MEVSLSEDFLSDLSSLSSGLEGKCRTILRTAQKQGARTMRTEATPGWRVHRLKSSPFVSISVDMNYRMLCTIEGERFRAFRVVKHDLADAAHVNRNASLEVPYDIADDKIQAKHVFDALVALGLAEDQVDAFRGVTDEDEFISALEAVDTDIQSLALSLYEITGLTIPRSKYTVFDDSKDFEAALRGDMDQWELYLHPSQRYVVELPVQHRIGVQGSAGTGKTVCAWHRLGFLASQGHSVGFVCANKAILEVSRDMLERLVQGTSTNCYFLIPNSRDELVQLAEEVEHIVFDEGQEFTPAWFSHLGQALSDKNTGITLFFDLNQIGGNIPSGDSARFEERLNSWHSSLESIPNIVRMPFHINYRNSREIIEFYRNALDGALPGDLGSNLPTFEAGQVVSEEVKSREELGIRIGAAIRAFQKDYGDNDIGLILNGHARENMRDVLAQLGKLGIRTSPDLHDRHRILVTSPRDIKGHERKAIIFCTAPIGNRVGRVGRAIDAYVALTRARDRLVVLETT